VEFARRRLRQRFGLRGSQELDGLTDGWQMRNALRISSKAHVVLGGSGPWSCGPPAAGNGAWFPSSLNYITCALESGTRRPEVGSPKCPRSARVKGAQIGESTVIWAPSGLCTTVVEVDRQIRLRRAASRSFGPSLSCVSSVMGDNVRIARPLAKLAQLQTSRARCRADVALQDADLDSPAEPDCSSSNTWRQGRARANHIRLHRRFDSLIRRPRLVVDPWDD
jgi:hypothetical protein